MERRSFRKVEEYSSDEEISPKRDTRKRHIVYRILDHKKTCTLPSPLNWTPKTATTQARKNEAPKTSNALNAFTFFIFFYLFFAIAALHIEPGDVEQQLQLVREAEEIAIIAAETHVLQQPFDRYWEKILYLRHSVKVGRLIQATSTLRNGACWCFTGEEGHVFMSLSHPISITHVTLGHIIKNQASFEYKENAPREFSVYGMTTLDDEGTYLGTLGYQKGGKEFQTFKLPKPDSRSLFSYVKLQIESHWGVSAQTCLYGFRARHI